MSVTTAELMTGIGNIDTYGLDYNILRLSSENRDNSHLYYKCFKALARFIDYVPRVISYTPRVMILIMAPLLQSS